MRRSSIRTVRKGGDGERERWGGERRASKKREEGVLVYKIKTVRTPPLRIDFALPSCKQRSTTYVLAVSKRSNHVNNNNGGEIHTIM